MNTWAIAMTTIVFALRHAIPHVTIKEFNPGESGRKTELGILKYGDNPGTNCIHLICGRTHGQPTKAKNGSQVGGFNLCVSDDRLAN